MKKETLEQFMASLPYYGHCNYEHLEGIEVGAKWQAEQAPTYTPEEVLIILKEFKEYLSFSDEIQEQEWFEQFKKK